jgi:toxin ParE1/3/4
MDYQIQVLDEAEEDIDESFVWYESQRTGLGYEFIFNLDEAFDFIKRQPEASVKRKKNIYRHVMNRFPFGIYYRIDKRLNLIYILAILHFKRKPTIWRRRQKR